MTKCYKFEKDKNITKVIYRIYKGEVIAVFPQEVGTSDVNTCMSYVHKGQHGSMSVNLRTKKPEFIHKIPINLLKLELERIGYDLQEVKRFRVFDREIRRYKITNGF